MFRSIELIDLVETAAISLILAGVLSHLLGSYHLIHEHQTPIFIPLTTLLIMAVFLFEATKNSTPTRVDL